MDDNSIGDRACKQLLHSLEERKLGIYYLLPFVIVPKTLMNYLSTPSQSSWNQSPYHCWNCTSNLHGHSEICSWNEEEKEERKKEEKGNSDTITILVVDISTKCYLQKWNQWHCEIIHLDVPHCPYHTVMLTKWIQAYLLLKFLL